MKRIFRFVIFAAVLMATACTEDITTDAVAGEVGNEENYTGETVRLGIEVTRASLDGLDMAFEAGDEIYVNGTILPVLVESGKAFVNAPIAEDNIYRAVFPALAATAFADSGNHAYVHSNMQTYNANSFGSEAMCLVAFADLNGTSESASLTFNAMLGVLKLTVKGDAEVRSIRLQNNAFDSTNPLTAMSGRSKFVDSEGTTLGANVIEGAHHAVPCGASGMTEDIVLLCNDKNGKGVTLAAAGTDFYFTVYPQEYPEGFTVTITDNAGKSQKFSTSGSTTVPVNTLVEMQPMTYAPDSDLLFSEPFDVCVYGGDVIACRDGSSVWRSRTPIHQDGTVITGLPILSDHTDQDGLQPGYFFTNSTSATAADGSTHKVVAPGLVFSDWSDEGTDYVNTMANVISAGKLRVTESLLNVRGLNDWYMSRCVEFLGYLSVGNERALNSVSDFSFSMNPLGILTTPAMSMIADKQNVEVYFDIASGDGVTGYCKKDNPSSSSSFWTYQPNATAADSANNIEWREDKFKFMVVGGSENATILKLEFIDENGVIMSKSDGSLMSYAPSGNYVEVPESDLPATWSRVKVMVANADAKTRFRFYNNQATRYMVYHIDNIEVRKSDLTDVPTNATVTGTVSCDGVPMEGVVVSDGVNVTQTDANGMYYLATDISIADNIRITIPSGYEMASMKYISPAFYSAVNSSASGMQTHNFQLKKVDQSNYTLMVMADSHVLNGAWSCGSTNDRNYYTTLAMPKWNEYAASCSGKVYGLHLGDMTQVGFWLAYPLSSYRSDTSVSTVPIFNVIGNHDHDKPLTGTFDETNQHLARKSFTTTLGPAYYSFEIGTEHYIVLDNSLIIDSDSATDATNDEVTEGYKIKVDPVQLEWLKYDVARIDSSKIKGVVICAHCPLYKATGGYYMINSSEVISAVNKFPLTILIGHNHVDRYTQTTTPTYGKTVREYVHPSLAGTAWLTLNCTDGTPASFVAYTFSNGMTTSRTFVPFGENEGLTYRAYDNRGTHAHSTAITEGSYSAKKPANDDTTLTTPAVIVNAWGSKNVSFSESTGGKGTSTRNSTYEPFYRDWFYVSLASSDRNSIVSNTTYPDGPNWQQPNKSYHVWKYVPADASATITATMTDEFGSSRKITLYAK